MKREIVSYRFEEGGEPSSYSTGHHGADGTAVCWDCGERFIPSQALGKFRTINGIRCEKHFTSCPNGHNRGSWAWVEEVRK